jgi:hypothetical protein
MMSKAINWFGLAAGIITLVVLVISIFVPWWIFTVGQNLITINASPINTNFGVLGADFTVPLIWALNISSILMFTAAGIVMLIYSVVPTKPYAKELLGFSWKKPFYAVIGFAVGLIVIVAIAGFIGVNVPLVGSANLSLPSSISNMLQGANISAAVTATFQLPFYLAIAAAVMCIGARL